MLVERIEDQKVSAIEQATSIAMDRLDREVEAFVGRSLRHLLINVLVKFILIALAFIIFELGWISATGFAIIAGILLGIFLIRDGYRLWPAATFVFKELRAHGWRLRQAVAQYISSLMFDQALQEVALQTADRKTRILLRVAGTSHNEVSLEIAQAVAEIAQEMSYDKVRPRIIMGVIRSGVIMGLYSATIFMIFQMV